MIPIHWLHIYQRPAVGNAFIKRYPTYNYKHKIAANGWFDTMECALGVTAIEAEQIYERYIGCRVAMFVDSPVEPIWEGIISRMTYAAGGVSLTRSLDEMMNRVTVRTLHTNFNTGVLSDESSGVANNTDSQAQFGIKEGSIDGGAIRNGNVQTAYMQAMRDTYLGQLAWPQVSMNFSNQNSTLAAFITLECTGFYHTLTWETVTTQNNTDAGTAIDDILTNIANGATFFDSSDTTDTATNTTLNYRPREESGASAWDTMKQIQEAGNSSGNPYVIGVSPTRFDTGTRRFYYRQANTDVEYTARLSDGLRIRNQFGGLLRTWSIQPDRAIRINDILPGWNGMGDDPREMYIETVKYDADKQSVSLLGADDITWEGFFQFKQMNKAYNRRAGATPRQILLA